MWSGDDYKRGWEDGHRDALEGKDRNTIRMGYSLRFLCLGRPALETYTEGYHQGYAQGMAQRHVVHRVAPETSAIFANQQNNYQQNNNMVHTSQDFTRELQALKDLNEFLVKFVNRNIMEEGLNEYHGAIQVLIDSGVPRQQCEFYINNYFQADKTSFQNLLTHIVDVDLPRIRLYMEEIDKHMQAATGMSAGDPHLSQPDIAPRPKRPRKIVSRQGGIADLEVQADAICDFGVFLKEMIEALHYSLREYEQYCNGLLEVGVPQQMYSDYLQHCATDDADMIHEIIACIEGDDIPYLKKVLDQIVGTITSLGGSYNRTLYN